MRSLWFFAIAAPMLLGSAVPPPPAARESPVLSPLRMSSAEPLIPAPRPTPAAAVPVFVSAPAAAAARPAPELPAPAPTPGAGAKKPGGPTAASRWARKAAKASSKKGVRVLVSLPQQRAYVFKGGVLAFTAPVSTGKRGHPTPVGTFRILLKKVHHNSSKYDNAPMPYMQRLTNYGIALHAGHVPGYPASHGCIRLPRGYAKTLYGLTDSSTRVTITNRRPKSAKEALTIA